MRTPCLNTKNLSEKKYKHLTEKLSCEEGGMFPFTRSNSRENK